MLGNILENASFFNIHWGCFLFMCGDVHKCPGPKTEHLRLMHWNLNSLKTNNFERINNLMAYNATGNCHIMAISESALHSNIENKKIEIPGFNSIRCDLLDSHTHGGVFMYYKQDLSAKHRIDLDVPTYTLVLEVNFGRKKVIIVHSYIKFGQSKDEYDDYITKFEELLDTINAENPYCCICVGDLNAHNKKWLSGGGGN